MSPSVSRMRCQGKFFQRKILRATVRQQSLLTSRSLSSLVQSQSSKWSEFLAWKRMLFLLRRKPILSLKNTWTVSLVRRKREAYLLRQYWATVMRRSFSEGALLARFSVFWNASRMWIFFRISSYSGSLSCAYATSAPFRERCRTRTSFCAADGQQYSVSSLNTKQTTPEFIWYPKPRESLRSTNSSMKALLSVSVRSEEASSICVRKPFSARPSPSSSTSFWLRRQLPCSVLVRWSRRSPPRRSSSRNFLKYWSMKASEGGHEKTVVGRMCGAVGNFFRKGWITIIANFSRSSSTGRSSSPTSCATSGCSEARPTVSAYSFRSAPATSFPQSPFQWAAMSCPATLNGRALTSISQRISPRFQALSWSMSGRRRRGLRKRSGQLLRSRVSLRKGRVRRTGRQCAWLRKRPKQRVGLRWSLRKMSWRSSFSRRQSRLRRYFMSSMRSTRKQASSNSLSPSRRRTSASSVHSYPRDTTHTDSPSVTTSSTGVTIFEFSERYSCSICEKCAASLLTCSTGREKQLTWYSVPSSPRNIACHPNLLQLRTDEKCRQVPERLSFSTVLRSRPSINYHHTHTIPSHPLPPTHHRTRPRKTGQQLA